MQFTYLYTLAMHAILLSMRPTVSQHAQSSVFGNSAAKISNCTNAKATNTH